MVVKIMVPFWVLTIIQHLLFRVPKKGTPYFDNYPSSLLEASWGLWATEWIAGLLSNQGEKSINFYFIRVPLRKKVLKYGTPKPRLRVLGFGP